MSDLKDLELRQIDRIVVILFVFTLTSCATQIGSKKAWNDYSFKIGESHLSMSIPQGQSMSFPVSKPANPVIHLPIPPDQSISIFSGVWDFGVPWRHVDCTLNLKMGLATSEHTDISTLLSFKYYLLSEFKKSYKDRIEDSWESYNNSLYTYTKKLTRKEFIETQLPFNPGKILAYEFNGNVWLATENQMYYFTTINANHYLTIYVGDTCNNFNKKNKKNMNLMTDKILDSIYLTGNLKLK
jgi:hypothetical protein